MTKKSTKLKNILSEIEEVSDDSIIKYKDKDGESKEMPAKSAKTMPHEHPAKQAWDTENEKDQGGGTEKPDPSKLSGSDFQRKSDDDMETIPGRDTTDDMEADMNDNEDAAIDYEDSILTNGDFEDVEFDDFDMAGNPVYIATTQDGDTKEVTVNQKNGNIYDYQGDKYSNGHKADAFEYGNVNEQTCNSGYTMNNQQEKMLKKIISESNTPGYENRKFGDSLPTLASVKKAYDASKGITEEESVDEAAPKMRKDPYVEKLRLLYKAVAKLDNQMNAADRSRYSHVKKDFNKALKAVAELTSALNRKGATIPN
jgi:hypothetical protein